MEICPLRRKERAVKPPSFTARLEKLSDAAPGRFKDFWRGPDRTAHSVTPGEGYSAYNLMRQPEAQEFP